MDVHPPNVASYFSLVDLFPHEPTSEGGEDNSLEWLSIYVEDCLSSSTSYTSLMAPKPAPTTATNQTAAKPKSPLPSSSKTRKKKRSLATVIDHSNDQQYFSWFLEPPLLDQTQWLAESELIFPKKDKDQELGQQEELEQVKEKKGKKSSGMDFQQERSVRRCSHCLSDQTPLWRDGPLGPKTLCNACGLRFKSESGLILPNKHQAQENHEQELGQVQDKNIKKSENVTGELQEEQPVKRCSHCMSYKTPQWRAGPLGPKTLCNACGVRFKSGRLLPEYRPANSPTFVSYKHSNSHKKVLQLRGAVVPSTHCAN